MPTEIRRPKVFKESVKEKVVSNKWGCFKGVIVLNQMVVVGIIY